MFKYQDVQKWIQFNHTKIDQTPKQQWYENRVHNVKIQILTFQYTCAKISTDLNERRKDEVYISYKRCK